MGVKFVLEVVASVLGATWWMVAILILLAIITFRRPLAASWRRVTEKVIWYLTWIHLRNQLPEDLEGPFGWRGGGGETIELGEGEEWQATLIPPPKAMWLAGQKPVNPKRKDKEGEPARGLPPLLLWALVYPTLTVAVTVLGWFVLWFFSRVTSSLAPRGPLTLAVLGSLLLMAPTYWFYEFNRRHRRLTLTTLMAHINVYQAVTREYHHSRSPTVLIEETMLDSSFSEEQNIILRGLGGWGQELSDLGDADLGTRVQEMADHLRMYSHISSLGEILQQLNSEAMEHKAVKELTLRIAEEFEIRGYADEAIGGVSVAGGRSALAEARARKAAVLSKWIAENPSGETLNLVDPRLLTRQSPWNLETGERLEPTEA